MRYKVWPATWLLKCFGKLLALAATVYGGWLLALALHPQLQSQGDPAEGIVEEFLRGDRDLGSTAAEAGVLHFLFLCFDRLEQPEIWQRFFAQAPHGSFTYWMHCVSYDKCKAQQLEDLLPNLQLVQTVPSLYSWDLFMPHVHLTRHAMDCFAPGTVIEKFVLVSGSTLPIKPFWHVQQELLSNNYSFVCPMRPEDEWTRWEMESNIQLIPKVSEWMVLNRTLSRRLVRRYFPAHLVYYAWPNATFVVAEKNAPCFGGEVDEWYYFDLLWGSYRRELHARVLQPSNCKTLVMWRKDKEEEAFLKADNESNITLAAGNHPMIMHDLSDHALRYLQQHPALFARKFDLTRVNPNLSEIFLGSTRESTNLRHPVPATCRPSSLSVVPEHFHLHFLFLLGQEMPDEHYLIWQKFFHQIDPASWTAWAACSSFPGCSKGRTLFRWLNATPRNRSFLRAYAHLLHAALLSGRGANEKFVLLSERTIPVQTFVNVSLVLQGPKDSLLSSDFCLRDAQHWISLVTNPVGKELFLVTHSRWAALSHNDAVTLMNVLHGTRRDGAKGTWYASRSLDGTVGGKVQRISLDAGSRFKEDSTFYFYLFGIFPPSATKQPLPLWQGAELTYQWFDNASKLLAQSRCPTLDLQESLLAHDALISDLLAKGHAKVANNSWTDLSATGLHVLQRQGYLFITPVTSSLIVQRVLANL